MKNKMMALKLVPSRILRSAAIAAIGCSLAMSAMATGYVATVLPKFGGSVPLPAGIDNSGAVTGTLAYGPGVWTGFLWKDGAMTDLGALGSNQETHSYAFQSNPAGQVTGYSYGPYSTHAYRYSNGVMTAITPGEAFGINASGDVVGAIKDNFTGASSAFLYRGGVLTDLGTFGHTKAAALKINNAGAVLGYTADADPGYSAETRRTAFVWKDGVATIIPPIAGNLSIAFGINDSGQVVGVTSIAAVPADTRLFTWKDGVMKDLGISMGDPAGYFNYNDVVLAINNIGQVMMSNGVIINNVFTPVENMLPPDLAPGLHGDLKYYFPTLYGINDAGQVAGRMTVYNKVTRQWSELGFVLTPTSVCN